MAVLASVVGPASDLLLLPVAKLIHRSAVAAKPIGRDRFRAAVALQRLLHERQRGRLVPRLRNEALQDLAFVINGSPEIDLLAVDLHEHLIKVPTPVPKPPHSANPLPGDVVREQRTKSIPPEPDRFVAHINPALKEQVLHIP